VPPETHWIMLHATALHAIDFHVFRLFKSLSRVWFALLVSLAMIGLSDTQVLRDTGELTAPRGGGLLPLGT